MKKLLFLGACLVALASSPVMAQTHKAEVVMSHTELAQTGGAEVVVVRVYDGTGKFVIGRPGGKVEELSFNPNYTSKGLAESTGQLQKAVASLYQQGYTLKSTFGGAQGSIATLIFVKEK
jgi:hypothetical protein